MFFEFDF